jgi:hypothetical protein
MVIGETCPIPLESGSPLSVSAHSTEHSLLRGLLSFLSASSVMSLRYLLQVRIRLHGSIFLQSSTVFGCLRCIGLQFG